MNAQLGHSGRQSKKFTLYNLFKCDLADSQSTWAGKKHSVELKTEQWNDWMGECDSPGQAGSTEISPLSLFF